MNIIVNLSDVFSFLVVFTICAGLVGCIAAYFMVKHEDWLFDKATESSELVDDYRTGERYWLVKENDIKTIDIPLDDEECSEHDNHDDFDIISFCNGNK